MSEKTIINGWSIRQGDYLRDADFDKAIIRSRKRKLHKDLMILICGGAAMVTIMVLSQIVR